MIKVIETIKTLRNFKDLTKSQKIHLVFFIGFLIFILLQPIMKWRVAIPSESDLQYSEGTLDYIGIGDGDILVILWPTKKLQDVIVFGCSYSADTSASNNTCMGRKYLEPYLEKRAKIGWYDQPSVLGFKNNVRQMVTMKSNGDYLKTYEKTKRINAAQNKTLVGITLFFFLLYTYVFFRIVYPTT